MAVVYQHIREDTNQIFYIGIELDSDKRKATGLRSTKINGRNKFWKNITDKTNYSIEILFNNLTNEESKEIEKYLIKFYGRRNLGLGSLVNLTDGGDGAVGCVQTLEHRTKTSNSLKGTRIGINNPMYGKNPYKNKIHYKSQKIINTETKEIYNTISELLKTIKIPKTTFLRWLKNQKLNQTKFIYYNEYNIN